MRRTKPIAFLAAFDAPTAELNCDRRVASTNAPQALMLMNSDFVLAQAGFFAQRLLKEAPGSLEKQVALAWQIAYGRPITPQESEAALRFVRKQQRRSSVLRCEHPVPGNRKYSICPRWQSPKMMRS